MRDAVTFLVKYFTKYDSVRVWLALQLHKGCNYLGRAAGRFQQRGLRRMGLSAGSVLRSPDPIAQAREDDAFIMGALVASTER